MSVEVHSIQPRKTGFVRGLWRERHGNQHVDIKVDPGCASAGTEFRVTFERRWGPQLGDTKTINLNLTREGAEILQESLTAALEWDDE